MNDLPLDDDKFDQRLRDDLAALVREAGDPPALATGRPSSGASRGRLVAAAAVALVVVVAGALMWSVRGHDRDRQSVLADRVQDRILDHGRDLVGARWWLIRAEQDGAPLDLGGVQDIGLHLSDELCDTDGSSRCRPSGPIVWASNSCNGFRGPYELPSPGTIELGSPGPSEQMGCAGPLVDAMRAVYLEGTVRYEVEGELLKVRRNGVVLTYEASDGPFAPTQGLVVDEGTSSGESHRLVWEGAYLAFQTADTDQEIAIGGTRLGEDPGRINPSRSTVGGRPYVLAIVPAASKRIVYEPVGGTPQEVSIHDVGSATSTVVGSFVDAAPDTWELVAYDVNGTELQRYHWGQ